MRVPLQQAAGPALAPAAVCPFGPEFQEFWDQRYDLFSRFDDGIQIDGPGLFGVKFEADALRLAQRVPGPRVLDAFAGWGGSAIAFARAGRQVVSCDIDGARLAKARHNAAVYGVEGRIEFRLADVRAVLAGERFDAVYLDPPWGGLAALERPRFRLGDYVVDGCTLLPLAFRAAPTVVLTAPPHFDLGDLLPLARPFEVAPVWHAGELQYLNLTFAGAPLGGAPHAAPSAAEAPARAGGA